MNSEIHSCQNCKQNFTIDPEDFSFYDKIKVPPPTFCFECRMQRKMARRNERFLYKRQCNLCNKDIISMYTQNTPFPVYCPTCWWGDNWDPTEYSRNYDFSRSFFEQWKDLMLVVPRVSLYQKNLVNSPYTNHSDGLKNSYLALNCGLSEYIFYSKWVVNSKDLADCYVVFDSELNYELYECKKCSRCSFSYFSKNCIDSGYLYNCYDCMNCFLSSNLRNKKYVFRNKQLSKENYDREMKVFQGSFLGYLQAEKIFKEEILPKTPRKYMVSGKQTNSYGDYIFGGCKNVRNCFRIYTSEDSAYSVDSAGLKDCFDSYESAFNCEQQYECHAGNRLSYSKFTSVSYDNHHLEYSEMCHDSEYLFSCIGLRKKKYCILNKQYTKEEYEELVPKIIKHMMDIPYIDKRGRIYKYGEFFPVEFSPFAYNETVAQEYYNLNFELAQQEGYNWKNKEERNYKIDINVQDLPDDISDVRDDVIGKAIACDHYMKENHGHSGCTMACTEAFKIIKEELSLYRRLNLPLPRLCPNCRHYNRQQHRNPTRLWHRSCMCKEERHGHTDKCLNEFDTAYAPERPETIYCEKCYQQEVY